MAAAQFLNQVEMVLSAVSISLKLLAALQENSRGFYDLRSSHLGEKRNRQPLALSMQPQGSHMHLKFKRL